MISFSLFLVHLFMEFVVFGTPPGTPSLVVLLSMLLLWFHALQQTLSSGKYRFSGRCLAQLWQSSFLIPVVNVHAPSLLGR